MSALTIFYVEDNEGDVMLLREALQERCAGVRLLVVKDGPQALSYLRVKATARDAPPPDLILLDTHLPGIPGSELLRFIRSDQLLREIPHVVFTSDPECREHREQLGMPHEQCVQKPVTWDAMLALVDRLYAMMVAYRRRIGRPYDDAHDGGCTRE
jgi:CheY-like chemotaxis protein